MFQKHQNNHNWKCGPMSNVMAALPNIDSALCSTLQNLADAHYKVPCSNAAKMRNPLKFAGVPQTGKPISAASGPKFTILSGHVEEVLLFMVALYVIGRPYIFSCCGLFFFFLLLFFLA